jgi:hypothetical protein
VAEFARRDSFLADFPRSRYFQGGLVFLLGQKQEGPFVSSRIFPDLGIFLPPRGIPILVCREKSGWTGRGGGESGEVKALNYKKAGKTLVKQVFYLKYIYN